MRIGVITFPGSLDERDAQRAIRLAGAEPDRLLGRLEAQVGDADLRALLREEDRRVAPHPAAGAGDHADLPFQPSGHAQASVDRNTFLTSE